MGTYPVDRAFTDRFEDELKRLIGALMVETASIRCDRKQATDFVVHQAANLCYASRVRRKDRNFSRYSEEFTIRSYRDNGVVTEMAKILAGWGDRLVYGWGTDDQEAGKPGSVWPWVVINLDVFRVHYLALIAAVIGREGGTGEKPNVVDGRRDGTWFRYFNLRDAASIPDLIVKADPEIPLWRVEVIHEFQCWHCGRRWNAPDAPGPDYESDSC